MILVMPGNGAASSLSWVLASGSAALVPFPINEDAWQLAATRPWVHFIPVERDLSDVEEKARWCLEHDRQCSTIAAAARRLLEPLWPLNVTAVSNSQFAARVANLERLVIREMLRRAQGHPECDPMKFARRHGFRPLPSSRKGKSKRGMLLASTEAR